MSSTKTFTYLQHTQNITLESQHNNNSEQNSIQIVFICPSYFSWHLLGRGATPWDHSDPVYPTANFSL